MGIGRGQQGGSNERGTRRQNQARGAVIRENFHRMAGGGWGRGPGGQHTTPVEDVVIG